MNEIIEVNSRSRSPPGLDQDETEGRGTKRGPVQDSEVSARSVRSIEELAKIVDEIKGRLETLESKGMTSVNERDPQIVHLKEYLLRESATQIVERNEVLEEKFVTKEAQIELFKELGQRMKQNFDLITQAASTVNTTLSANSEQTRSVPFPDRVSAPALPEVNGVVAIDNLTKAQCRAHLNRFEISDSLRETINLKKRLRKAYCYDSPFDMAYKFSRF